MFRIPCVNNAEFFDHGFIVRPGLGILFQLYLMKNVGIRAIESQRKLRCR